MTLLVFFTFGLSLKKWDECGNLERELALYKQFAARGLDVTLLTYGDQSDYDYRESISPIKIIPVYAHIKRPRFGILRFFQSLLIPFRLRKHIRRVDVLKTNQMWGSWVAVIAKIICFKKLLLRSGYEQFRFAVLMKMALGFKVFVYINSLISYWLADSIVISSEIGKSDIGKYFYIRPQKIKVIPNYVETERFCQQPHVAVNDRVLFIGRLEEQKNVRNLLDAIKQTVYELDIYGEGSLKSELIEYTRDNNIKAHFFKRVSHEHLPEIYNRYPVYILPSFFEGMPKTLVEAMSCGRAVIGANSEGIREFIRNGETGVLCEPTPGPIAVEIEKLMEDPDKRERLGKAARRYIVENFSLKKIVEAELSIYQPWFDREKSKAS